MLKSFAAIANAVRTAVGGLLQVTGPSAGQTRTMTVPDANFTAARTDAAQSFTGAQTFGGSISVGNATPSASGAGITFPATQSASSDANTLDDYEEGTWTPTWVFGTSGSAATIYAYGTYTKVGRAVHIRVQIYSQTFLSGTGNVSIGGLPFTSSNANGNDVTAVAVGIVDSWTTDMPNLKASIANNATTIRLSKNASNAAVAYVQGSDMNTSDGKNGIIFSGTYFV